MGVIVSISRSPRATVFQIKKGSINPRTYFESIEQHNCFFPSESIDSTKDYPKCLLLDTSWEVILFLISAEIRNNTYSSIWTSVYKSPLSWAIVGAQFSKSDNSADQLLRFSNPEQVKEISETLDNTHFDEFFCSVQEVSYRTLANPGLSSVQWPGVEDETRFRRIFSNIKLFYSKAAANSEWTIHLRA